MRTGLTLQQTHILDSHAKNAWWLLTVYYDSANHYWTDVTSKSYGENSYTFKIAGFTDLNMEGQGAENGIFIPSEWQVEIINAGNTINPANMVGGTILLRLVMSADLNYKMIPSDTVLDDMDTESDVQETEIASWKFDIVNAYDSGQQTIICKCESFFAKYLRQDFPTGKLVHDEFPDNTNRDDNACIPVVYGADAYIPVASVYNSNLSNLDGGMDKVLQNNDIEAFLFNSGNLTSISQITLNIKKSVDFTDDDFLTVSLYSDIDNQPGISLVNEKKYGNEFTTEYQNITFSIPYTLSSSTNYWITLEPAAGASGTITIEVEENGGENTWFVGPWWYPTYYDYLAWFIFNFTGRRYYLLGASGPTYTKNLVHAPQGWGDTEYSSANYTFTADTITGRSGTNYAASRFNIVDTDNDGAADANGLFFDGSKYIDVPCQYYRSDTNTMTDPAAIWEHIIEALGVPSAEFDDTQKAVMTAIYAGWGLAWTGGFWFKESAENVLADLSVQSNSGLIIRDKLYLKNYDKTSQLTLEDHHILVDDNDEETYRCYPIDRKDRKDSMYVAYRPTGVPCDSLLKIIVPADIATSYPSKDCYDMPLVHDSQHVQKLGTLAAQRKLNRKYEVEVKCDPRILQLEVLDVFTLASADFGGPVNALITGMRISQDLDITIRATVYTVTLKNWADLSPGAVTIVTDDSTDTYRKYIYGPDNADGASSIRGSVNANDISVGLLNARTMQTSGTRLTRPTEAADTTVYLADTTDFPASGTGYICDDTVDEFTYAGKTATTLTGCSGVLAHDAGLAVGGLFKRMVVSAEDNEMHFFGDRGDGTIEELASIGIKAYGDDNVIGYFGSSDSNCDKLGVLGLSYSATAIAGVSVSGIAVHGSSISNIGVEGDSIDSTGVLGASLNEYGGKFSTFGKSPLLLVPSGSAAAPTHSADIGALWVTSAGVLYINTSGSTTWTKVGAQ